MIVRSIRTLSLFAAGNQRNICILGVHRMLFDVGFYMSFSSKILVDMEGKYIMLKEKISTIYKKKVHTWF